MDRMEELAGLDRIQSCKSCSSCRRFALIAAAAVGKLWCSFATNVSGLFIFSCHLMNDITAIPNLRIPHRRVTHASTAPWRQRRSLALALTSSNKSYRGSRRQPNHFTGASREREKERERAERDCAGASAVLSLNRAFSCVHVG